jgi:two-component system, sensor histidine kinase and response regulator
MAEAEKVILCVDDEVIVLKSLRRELNDVLGDAYLVETAESAEEALEVFQECLREGSEVPVVIADHIMPEVKGAELLERIHALAPETLNIMLTGQADLDAVTYTVNHANLYRYIAKPWEKTDLALTIKEALRRYEQDKQLKAQNLILQNMNTILEQQVKERTAELEAQKQELKQANASKDKFFSIIAHDLRAPFVGLLGLTEVFTESVESFTPEDIQQGMKSLQQTAQNVYTLVENLLTWARLQRGLVEFFPEELVINGIVRQTLELFHTNAAQKQITLRNLATATTLAYADRNMIHTVLRNLLSNALKFTTSEGVITVSATQSPTHVEITVADTGTGIAKKDLAKLFRIDVKYSHPGTAGEKGSGLGLILCKELVEKNGGKLSVESKIRKGTTFRFTLPTLAD